MIPVEAMTAKLNAAISTPPIKPVQEAAERAAMAITLGSRGRMSASVVPTATGVRVVMRARPEVGRRELGRRQSYQRDRLREQLAFGKKAIERQLAADRTQLSAKMAAYAKELLR